MPKSPTHSRQRHYARRPVAVRARCAGTWGNSTCLISDISLNGASFICGHAPRIGEQLTLEWTLGPESQQFRVQCQVKHVSHMHTGVAFVDISPSKKRRIAEFLHVA